MSLMRQSGAAGAAAAFGIMSGLLFDLVIAFHFGAGSATDAYFVGARIPLAVGVVALVAANQVLLPTVSRWMVADGERAHRQSGELLGAGLWIGLGIALALAALAVPTVAITAPGLGAAERATAAAVLVILSAGVPLTLGAEVLRAYLNAHYSFVVPAGMNIVSNGVAMVLAALVLAAMDHKSVKFVALALLAGMVVRLLVLLGLARRKGLRMALRPRRPSHEVTQALRRTARPLLTGGLVPAARLVEQAFASYLPSGAISILNYGHRLVSGMGGTVLFRSVVVTLLPRLSACRARGDGAGAQRLSALAVAIMVSVSVPLLALAAGLVAPATALLFERGGFGSDAAAQLASILAVLALSLPADALQRAYLLPFFAELDTRVPLRNVSYGVLLNICLLPLAVMPLAGDARATIAVAACYTVSQWAQAAHARFRLHRSFGTPNLYSYRRPLVTMLAASAVTAAVTWIVTGWWYEPELDGSWVLLLGTVATAAAGLLPLIAAAWIGRRQWIARSQRMLRTEG